jgi:hypothetical protein
MVAKKAILKNTLASGVSFAFTARNFNVVA